MNRGVLWVYLNLLRTEYICKWYNSGWERGVAMFLSEHEFSEIRKLWNSLGKIKNA